MTSRMADSMELVKRCLKVAEATANSPTAWTVIRNSAGQYKIKNDKGNQTLIHMTYSDYKSLLNAEQRLKRMGLHEKENEMAELKFSDGKQRTTRAQAAADKKALAIAEEAERNAALNRASGPYQVQPEDVGVMWFAEKHPAPWMRVINMTPEIAQYLLDMHNDKNRPISNAQVEHYRRIIHSGQWKLTHQGAAMDTEANLQDSQHRLSAIVLAGDDQPDLKVPMAFWVGMPVENFKAIDEGRLRTASQLFARQKTPYHSNVQTTVRMWLAYQDDNPRSADRIKRQNAEILDAYDLYAEEFAEATAWGVKEYRKVGTRPASLCAARFILPKVHGGDNEYIAAFFRGLVTGHKPSRQLLDEDDPRFVIRLKLENAKYGNRRYTGLDHLAMIILAWNSLVQDLRPRYLNYKEDGPFPRPMLCRPGTGAPPVHLDGEIGVTGE